MSGSNWAYVREVRKQISAELKIADYIALQFMINGKFLCVVPASSDLEILLVKYTLRYGV